MRDTTVRCRFFQRSWCLTLFGSGCYTRRVPIGRGFALVVRTLGLFKLNRQVEPTTTLDPFRQSAKQPASVPHLKQCEVAKRL